MYTNAEFKGVCHGCSIKVISCGVISEHSIEQVMLPKQLETVTKATQFPTERHRWNTNEVSGTWWWVGVFGPHGGQAAQSFPVE